MSRAEQHCGSCDFFLADLRRLVLTRSCGPGVGGTSIIHEGLPMDRETALLTSADRMPERSQHRVSGGQDGRSERPATVHGQP